MSDLMVERAEEFASRVQKEIKRAGVAIDWHPRCRTDAERVEADLAGLRDALSEDCCSGFVQRTAWRHWEGIKRTAALYGVREEPVEECAAWCLNAYGGPGLPCNCGALERSRV
jgi:hypothetical protein